MSKIKAALEILTSEIWAIEPKYLDRMFAAFSVLDTVAKTDPTDQPIVNSQYINRDGVAHIAVNGPIMKEVPSIFKWFGIKAASTSEIGNSISNAVKDDKVTSIMLDIDSPGGTVSGVPDLADKIHEAKKVKPIHAHAQDQIASAAYWLGSQATSLSANQAASVGSIGVFTVVNDFSENFAQEGIKTHVISNNELKGIGVLGSKLTDNQKAQLQKEVDSYTNLFKASVSRGRNFSPEQIDKIATGAMWLGEEAEKLNLIDAVKTSDQAHSALVGLNNAPNSGAIRSNIMDEKMLAELKAAHEKEIQALKEEAEKAKAKADAELAASRDAIKALRETQKKELLVKYQDRYSPASKASIEAFASKCESNEELESFLSNLPVITRSAQSQPMPQAAVAGDLTDEEKLAIKRWGTTESEYKKYKNVRAYDPSNGKWIMNDGSVVDKLS